MTMTSIWSVVGLLMTFPTPRPMKAAVNDDPGRAIRRVIDDGVGVAHHGTTADEIVIAPLLVMAPAVSSGVLPAASLNVVESVGGQAEGEGVELRPAAQRGESRGASSTVTPLLASVPPLFAGCRR